MCASFILAITCSMYLRLIETLSLHEPSQLFPIERSPTLKCFIPNDCWKLCLEYLSSPSDIVRFRILIILSKRHQRLHDSVICHKSTDFQFILEHRSNCKRYRSQAHLEHSVPLTPCGSIDLNDLLSIKCLIRFHVQSEKHIIRGLELYSGNSFLSTFLRHDSNLLETVLLICICDHVRFQDVRLYKNIHKRNGIVSHNGDIGVDDLHKLWKWDHVFIYGLDECLVWTMESRGKWTKRRMIEKCVDFFHKLWKRNA